jgi:hypothetical protein
LAIRSQCLIKSCFQKFFISWRGNCGHSEFEEIYSLIGNVETRNLG